MGEYEAGADESEDHLFTEVFIDLKQANTKVAKLKTAEAVKILKDNYADYHALYAEKRKEWELIPAEELADAIFEQMIGKDGPFTNFRVIDFGHGIDGLFEEQLAKRVTERINRGTVTAVAVDVKELASAAKLCTKPSTGTAFTCETFAHDYTEILAKVEFTTKHDLHSFDAAVFCLSIMAEDALGKSLLLCSKLVKAKGAIMVIIPVQKLLGIMPGNKQTETYTRHWEHHFKALSGGFGVSKFDVINNQQVYLRLENVGFDATGLEEKLKNLSIKMLKQLTQKSVKKLEQGKLAMASASSASASSAPPQPVQGRSSPASSEIPLTPLQTNEKRGLDDSEERPSVQVRKMGQL